MTGKIIKGIAGFYYVHVIESGVYECKAKGIFRKKKIKPLVGDNVTIQVVDELEKKGNIEEIHPRKTQLIRPAVANIEQAVIIFAIKKPEPHFNLLDRFLIMMEMQNIKTIICFNKTDLSSEKEQKELEQIYKFSGYKLIFTNTHTDNGLDEFYKSIQGKITVVAGPSGVGKSSIINLLQSEAQMETGEISSKIERGKHTTRHSQLISVDETTYIMDTPGFSSLLVMELEKEEVKEYFPEFRKYEDKCKFQGCVHINEPSCGVKSALVNGLINKSRYENYKIIFEEIKNKKKY
jgi:ribosome small subunit-dependent GTPase A